MSNHTEEKLKKAKEISDLKSEIQKIEELLNAGRLDELSTHLQKLNAKYLLESALYNMSHPCPPKSTPENARNCIDFLSALLAEKVLDLSNKK